MQSRVSEPVVKVSSCFLGETAYIPQGSHSVWLQNDEGGGERFS